MKAEIITIGDEILIGQIVDTNSAWMGQQLNPIGVDIVQISSISDQVEHIIKAINEARGRADIILITGGLGPTKDDVTKKTLAKYFDSEMAMDPIALEHVTQIFAKRNLKMIDINEAQALLPVKCKPLYNPVGTAPGMWFEENEQVVVSMPGVPYEMKKMMTEKVIPMLLERYTFPVIHHKNFLTSGIGESFLSKRIAHLEDSLPPHIKLAYLPNYSTVRLRFSARGQDAKAMESELEEIGHRLKEIIPEYLISDEDIRIQEVIGRILQAKKLKIGTAESCTGGYMAHLITSVAGSSAYFMGSVVSYSNEVKMQELGVQESTLTSYGAVSKETVLEMAEGLRKKLGLDYAIASSGIAGPGGGTETKPVGTVWLAVAGPKESIAKDYLLYGERLQIIERSAMLGLDLLRKAIEAQDI
ncbi:MAG: competence/damage-inducible protein A [Bacteroidetes bacterium]|nr:MAG: competence/damage-inducible protein A [Bacteroidota bacterium]